MAKRKTTFPRLLTELALNSWETIARRTLMMATARCSPAEYRRMIKEKEEAMALSGAVFVGGRGKVTAARLIAPWHARSSANAKRLRKKR